MPENKLTSLFSDIISGHKKRLEFKGKLGNGQSSNPFDVPGKPNHIWVRIFRGSTETLIYAINEGVSKLPNLPVIVTLNDNNEYVVSKADSAALTNFTDVPGANVAPHTHDLSHGNADFVETQRILEGLLRVYSGLTVEILPINNWNWNGTNTFYGGGTVNLTSNVPSAAAMQRWAKIGINITTKTIEVVNGSDVSLLTPLTVSDLISITFSSNDVMPIAGIKLRYGATSIPTLTDIVDIRPWLSGTAGASPSALSSAPYITKTPSSDLSNEFALSTLATGILKNTTSTGVPTIAVAGTDYTSPTGVENLSNKTILSPLINTPTINGSSTVVSAVGATWNGININAGTASITGSTNINTTTGLNYVNIARPTLNSTNALVIANAATVYIANSPAVSGLASLTNAYALWVDDGVTRLDGNLIAASVTISGGTIDNVTINAKDTLFTLQDDSDTTKQLQFQLSGITTATIRTLTAPDTNGTIALVNATGQGYVMTAPTATADNMIAAATATIVPFTIQTTDDSTTNNALEILNSTGATKNFILTTAGRIGIGVAPTSLIQTTLDALSSWRQDAYSNTAASDAEILTTRGRGTTASKLDVTSGDTLFTLSVRGFFSSGNRVAANIVATVDNTPTATFVPGKLAFYTSSTTASATSNERLRIDSTGSLTINNGSAADVTANLLVIKSTASHTGDLTRWVNSSSTVRFAVGGDTVASAASATLRSLYAAAQTITITGSTNITTATGFNLVEIGRPTYSSSNALTITNGATLYIANAPTVSGSASLTNAYALWVDNGVSRFDGQIRVLYSSGLVFDNGAGLANVTLISNSNADLIFQLGSSFLEKMHLFNNGNLMVGSTTDLSARLGIQAAASGIGLIVRTNATTPGNIQEWQNSSGTALSSITSAGVFSVPANATTTSNFILLSPIHAPTGSETYQSIRVVTDMTSSTNNSARLWGINLAVTVGGSAAYSNTSRAGAFNISYGGSTSISKIIGGDFQVSNTSTGTITDAQAGHFFVTNSGGGTITNAYGIYIDAITQGGTLNYAIYTNNGLVHFGDSVDLASGKNITLVAGNLITDTSTGTKIGTVGGSSGQKLGFFGATPIVQPLLATGAGATVDDVITALQNLGLVRQS